MHKTLVIGYGNTLRGDDAAGVRAVEIIAEQHPTIDCLTLTELTPDLAEKISYYDRVVFVDASVNVDDVRWQYVPPPIEHNILRSHALTPQSLVGITIALYDHCPADVILVEIPARTFAYCEQFSTHTQSMIHKFVAAFAERFDALRGETSTAEVSDQSHAPTQQFLPTGSLPS